MSGEKDGFKVTDKRHFTPGGESRGPEVSPRDSASEPSRGEAQGGHVAGPPPVISFGDFLLGLAAQASVLLRGGSGSQEAEGLPAADPEGARHVIAILEMLRDKTDGRRTDEESRLLDGILFELRLAYVERTRKGGA